MVRYDWDFGDGTRLADGGANPIHVYSQPGQYRVTVTVADDENCSRLLVFTGQTVACNGSLAATASRVIQVHRETPQRTLPAKESDSSVERRMRILVVKFR